MSVLIYILVYYILLSITLKPLFEKAGVEGSKAYIPGVNFVEWCKLIGRPAWWAALLLIPIVNIFILAGMCVDMVRSFGQYEFKDSALAVIYAPIIFYQIGKETGEKYVGPILDREKDYAQKLAAAEAEGDKRTVAKLHRENPYQKSSIREWVEAIVFAVFAAAFIRMFLIEAYVIPTSSMEGSLLTGDFLFVSKAHYGMRMPMTVLQLPLVHNTTPLLGTESYLKKPSLSYTRLPKITEIKRNDPIVFNYPEGDSVFVTPYRIVSIYDTRRSPTYAAMAKGHALRVRPIDKRDHYIKRCIGIAGDKIEVKDRQVYVNDQPAQNPAQLQFEYIVNFGSNVPTDEQLLALNLNELDVANEEFKGKAIKILHLSESQKEGLKALSSDVTFEHSPRTNQNTPGYLFPHDPKNYPGWTVDNYGPVVIPKAGESVVLTPNNISMYHRVIEIYEGNKLEVKNGRIFINGEQTTNYTFKQDYYWAMGDNRHNSEDSRYWGFVPEDHIVGKPLFIWFSTKGGNIFNGINWDRIFTSANKM